MLFDPTTIAALPIGPKVVELNIWAIRQGLDGADAQSLFDGYCARLVEAGLPLWRGFAAMRTLHPQWNGYGFEWRRAANAIESESYERGGDAKAEFQNSPFAYLIKSAASGGTTSVRRRLVGPQALLDFPILADIKAEGASDYVAHLFPFGRTGDASQGTGVAFSFATDRAGGFDETHICLFDTTLPALALALKAHANHKIAASLLEAYLGADAGRRVHNGEIQRGTAGTLRAVLWFADIRGFTRAADALAGPELIDLLDDMLECMTAPLRTRGGQVLKFLGDGLLATFAYDATNCAETCAVSLDAAAEAMRALDALNERRRAAGRPVADFDLALHLGDVLYGNIGAVDRLDFTVIGPAVNEVARLEALCEPLGRRVLVSSALADAAQGCRGRLVPLGQHVLRGVREPRDIYALDLV